MFTLIVIDYRSMRETLQYIKDVAKNILFDGKLDVVVVDNSEFDSTNLIEEDGFLFVENKTLDPYQIKMFELESINLAYLFANENLGYAKGNNLGAYISDCIFGHRYYLISNNDLRFTKAIEWREIEDLFLKNPSVAVIGPKITGLNGKPQSPHKKISVFKSLFLYFWVPDSYFIEHGDLDYTSESKTCYRIIGCFMFVDADAFSKIKGFDTNTFLYAEEMILSERLLSASKQTYFYDEMEIIHGHPNKKNSKETIIKLKKEMYKSCRYYYSEYRRTPNFILRIADACFKLNILLRNIM